MAGQSADVRAQPILYDSEIKLPAEVVESYPTRLPPLHCDVPTLVVGKINKPGTRLDYTLTGKLTREGAGVSVQVSEKMPQSDAENFFLVNMIEQWKGQKDRPALMQADRAWPTPFEHNQMARADLVAQAEWAMEKNKFAVAERLFRQALKADPTSERAKAGLQLADDLPPAGRRWKMSRK